VKKTVVLYGILAILLLGCVSYFNAPYPDDIRERSPGTINYDIVIPDILMPVAAGFAVEENEYARIDHSNKQDGYIMVSYIEETYVSVKVLINSPDDTEYQYSLNPYGDFEAFPLSEGNGTYEISVYKNIDGSQYISVMTTTIDVVLINEYAPFLRPNQIVNFHKDNAVVRKAAELTFGMNLYMEKISAIYQYIIDNISYDTELAESVESGYIPNIDRVLARGQGICFDYAAVMTAMLRSQGIPTKLVTGQTGEIFHAWIRVYHPDDGWLDDLIFLNAYQWNLIDPTYGANIDSEIVSIYIGDGNNYVDLYYY